MAPRCCSQIVIINYQWIKNDLTFCCNKFSFYFHKQHHVLYICFFFGNLVSLSISYYFLALCSSFCFNWFLNLNNICDKTICSINLAWKWNIYIYNSYFIVSTFFIILNFIWSVKGSVNS